MSEKLERDNRQFRMGDNRYRRVILKGADPTTFQPAQLLEFDPADGKWIVYTGGLITDRTRAILNIDEPFVMAGVVEIPVSILIAGDVYADKIDFSAVVDPAEPDIDSQPTGAVLSIREQLRDVGILAFDSTELTENHTTV